MRRAILGAIVAGGIMLSSGASFALEASDLMGLSPDQVQGLFNNDQSYNQLVLEAIKERNRREEYQQRNPFAHCATMGEVRGADIEEIKTLGRKVGATNYQLVETTAASVRAKIYKCPQQQ